MGRLVGFAVFWVGVEWLCPICKSLVAQTPLYLGRHQPLSTAVDQGVARNARGNVEVDLNSSGPLNANGDRSMNSSISGTEIPLEQLPPLERLREAKRRARVDRDSDTQEPQS